ncbi:Scr1 family TA system antitoxin-like transcriptional regulator [Streptomyces sp. NPDC056653]|uniref:Scr1 family TA system antitoxin-like transcriptional regulator n=1 Tax=Streptomyces sp. NPDC056653 TaxID=3345894 RepID=UPI003689815C
MQPLPAGRSHGAPARPRTHTIDFDAAALRSGYTRTTAARRSRRHLGSWTHDVSERRHITLRMTPFDAGAFLGAGQTVNYSEGPVPQLDTVQVGGTHGPEFLYGEAQLAKYRSHLDRMERIALPPEKSRDFIHDIARHL